VKDSSSLIICTKQRFAIGSSMVFWSMWIMLFHVIKLKKSMQDCLRKQSVQLQAWIAQGAAIYVCGSLQGMASGVDQVLKEILGHEQVEQLKQQQRYQRDVY
jgi:hypothetical protein